MSSIRRREGRARTTGKRKRHTAEFEAKAALEALRGELTAARLAAEHGIHQTMVGGWKRQAVERSASVSSGKAEAQEVDRPGLMMGKDLDGQRHALQRRRPGPCRRLADEQAREEMLGWEAVCAARAERTTGRACSAGPPQTRPAQPRPRITSGLPREPWLHPA